MCDLYVRHGVDLGPLTPLADEPCGFAGDILLAPPPMVQDRWARRLADPVACFASGWMGVRQRARQRGVELGLVISDHADWDELTDTIREVAPQEVWITHGRDDALARWAHLEGRVARRLEIAGYDDEDA